MSVPGHRPSGSAGSRPCFGPSPGSGRSETARLLSCERVMMLPRPIFSGGVAAGCNRSCGSRRVRSGSAGDALSQWDCPARAARWGKKRTGTEWACQRATAPWARTRARLCATILPDEATASLDEASEVRLYRLLEEKLPATTIVSIGHRSTLEAFHQRNVEFTRDGDRFALRNRTENAKP